MRSRGRRILAAALMSVAPALTAAAAPRADLWPRWQAHDPASTVAVDHTPWQRFLDAYLMRDDPSGINRLRYARVSAADREALAGYLERLQSVPVSELNRNEQRAYWINLYNALTVKVVLDHYPVSSITRINLGGLFSRGPWNARLATVEGQGLSLNDIEHRILRPIWKDPRIHYAVNCASLGCPNLQGRAYTAANADELLEEAARGYVNHPRGARFQDGVLVLSSIYDWFREDFGGSRQGVFRHLLRYARPALAEMLRGYGGRIRYEYDWTLNEPGR